jgi:FkbM family methyltransferase
MLNLLLQVARSPMNRGARRAAIMRLVRYQVAARLSPALVYPFVNDTRVLVRKGMTGVTQNLYCGLSEPTDMAFTLHLLRPGDLFVDVGANVGCYTVLASGAAGADSLAFEPSPATYRSLMDNIHLNVLNSVRAMNAAVGAERGELQFTEGFDTMNHVVAPGETNQRSIKVPVHTLSEMLNGRPPSLIKIDTEGFETEVIRGGRRFFESGSVQAMIVEMNGSGDRYGFDERALDRELCSYGYHAVSYDPFGRRLTDGPGMPCPGNRIYVADMDWVSDRVESASRFLVRNTNTYL